MVEPATSLGRSGLQDWLIQRITAIILALYMGFLLGYLMVHPNLNYEVWSALFASNLMRYSSLLALLSIIAHAWIGLWTVMTDYLKPVILRLLVQVIVMLALLTYFVWGIQIMWRF